LADKIKELLDVSVVGVNISEPRDTTFDPWQWHRRHLELRSEERLYSFARFIFAVHLAGCLKTIDRVPMPRLEVFETGQRGIKTKCHLAAINILLELRSRVSHDGLKSVNNFKMVTFFREI